jgi:signal-transduction protein with cAMP-binding, CBS, and nucleotidyltransferase domain
MAVPVSMTIPDRVFGLKSIPLFRGLRDSEIVLIAEASSVRYYKPGEVVCSSEKPLQRLHIIINGSVHGAGGIKVPPVFSVSALLFGLPVIETLRASETEGATCLLLSKGNFYTTINECPVLIANLLEFNDTDELLIL